MFKTAEELDPARHGKLFLKSIKRYDFAHAVTSAPLGISEVLRASRHLPVVFPSRGRLLPIAQMAFRQNENLLVNQDGSWRIDFVPAHVRRYPFILGGDDGAKTYIVMVDVAALSEDGEGEPLFVDGDIPRDGVVEHARSFLIDFEKELRRTERLLAPLEEHNLLEEKVYSVKRGDETLGQVSGFRVVNRKRLATLDDAVLANLARSGVLEIIYAHLQSLQNWTSLTQITKEETPLETA